MWPRRRLLLIIIFTGKYNPLFVFIHVGPQPDKCTWDDVAALTAKFSISPLRPIGPEGLLSSPSCAAVSTAVIANFGYYTRWKIIIHVAIQPLPQILFTQGRRHMSKAKFMVKDSKQNFVNVIT